MAPRSDAQVEDAGAEVRSQVVRPAEHHQHQARRRQMRNHRPTPHVQLVRVEAHPERPRDRRCRIPRDLIFQNPHRADLGTVRAVNETSGSK